MYSTVMFSAAGYFAYEGPSVGDARAQVANILKPPSSSIDNPLLIEQHNPDNTNIFGDLIIGASEVKY